MSYFVCDCGCRRFDIEHLPRGMGWCRLLLTCKGCGDLSQVFGEHVCGVIRFRITGPVRLVTKGQCVPDPAVTRMSPSDCPASWEFREVD